MSTKFLFAIAEATDDAELRMLIRRTSMPGSISLSWSREPSFFAAQQVGCIRSETIVCRRSDTGNIIGFGGRSLWNTYQDGVEKTVWYLHSLRLLVEERDGTALLRGYRYFASLPNGSDVPYFITTILDDNEYAKKVLERRCPGMPVYTRVGTMGTYLVPLRVHTKLKHSNTIAVCNSNLFPSACEFINTWNRQYEFAAVHKPDSKDELFHGFPVQNLYTSLLNGKVNGTLGIWNQQSFKQLIVDSYSPVMNIGRYIHNAWSYIKGYPYLPPEGKEISMVHATCISAQNNDVSVFRRLLEQAISDWSGIGHDWMAIGVSAGHPFEEVLLKKSIRRIVSGVYIVDWGNEEIVLPKKDIHLEIALL